MKFTKFIVVVGALLAGGLPAITSANAEVIRKTVVRHEGAFGHGCRTVRIVKRGFGERRVIVRKVCR